MHQNTKRKTVLKVFILKFRACYGPPKKLLKNKRMML